MKNVIQVLIRNSLFPVIVKFGLEKILWKTDDSILVLMYHGVSSTGDTRYNGRNISVSRFKKHMEYLSHNFQILSLKDGFAQVGTKSNGKPRVCITFDDGFENNLVHAASILNSMGIPATVFVSSICVTGESELSKSKQLLETCIGKKVDCIAFPDGSYNSDIKSSSYRIGYERLCAVSFKLEEDLSDNRILKRSAVSSTTSYASNVIHFYRNFRKDGN